MCAAHDALPVRYIEWHASTRIFDPEFCHTLEEHYRAIERVRNGRSTIEEEFGTPMTQADLRAEIDKIYDDNPSMVRRYKLPKHWHWMGD